MSGLSLPAQVLNFEVDLTCADGPFAGVDLTTVTGVNLRLKDPATVGVFADRETYPTFAMTAGADNVWTYGHDLNGGSGNAEARWYFEAIAPAPSGNGDTTYVEFINNDFQNADDVAIYACEIGFANGPIRRSFFPGVNPRTIRASFGSCFLCNGQDLTITIDVANVEGQNSIALFEPISAGFPITAGQFLLFDMQAYTDNGSATEFAIRFPMKPNDFFFYTFRTGYVAGDPREAGVLTGALSSACNDVAPWGGRSIFVNPGEATSFRSFKWGTPISSLPAGNTKEFTASSTITAAVAAEGDDGYTYYLKDGRLLIGIRCIGYLRRQPGYFFC